MLGPLAAIKGLLIALAVGRDDALQDVAEQLDTGDD